MASSDDVKVLLEQDVTLLEALNAVEYTPLMMAARGGHLAVVKYLVQCGADIHHRGRAPMDDTAVELAAGRVEVAIFLLRRGAVISRHFLRQLLYDAAVTDGNVDAVRYLLGREDFNADNFNSGGMPLRVASEGGHAGVMQALLESGVNPFAEGASFGCCAATVVTFGKVNSHACVRIFEEWKRAYLLTKAQRLHEAVRSITSVKQAHRSLKSNNEKRAARIAAAPAYLKTRAHHGTIMPRVDTPCVGDDGSTIMKGQKGGGKRKGYRSGRACSEGVRRAVVSHVVTRLTSELCMELVGVMGMAALDGVRTGAVKRAKPTTV